MSTKPYQYLGIGDLESAGRAHAHLFTFKAVDPEVPESHPTQRWLSRGVGRNQKTDVCVHGGSCILGASLFSDGDRFTSSVDLNAQQCVDLAKQLLTAAMLLEQDAAAATPEQQVAA